MVTTSHYHLFISLPPSPHFSTGKCVGGIRHIPVKMLDVAGLVPGMFVSKELGGKEVLINQFFSGASEGKV